MQSHVPELKSLWSLTLCNTNRSFFPGLRDGFWQGSAWGWWYGFRGPGKLGLSPKRAPSGLHRSWFLLGLTFFSFSLMALSTHRYSAGTMAPVTETYLWNAQRNSWRPRVSKDRWLLDLFHTWFLWYPYLPCEQGKIGEGIASIPRRYCRLGSRPRQ